jgi:hypothetical protein
MVCYDWDMRGEKHSDGRIIVNTKKAEREELQTAQLRLKRLSPERLHVAGDFLAYLEEREANEATEELLRLSDFQGAFANALEEVESGAVLQFENIRRDL